MEKPVQEPAKEPQQETATGHKIPMPSKSDVMRFFEKVAKPKKG
jgi:hypothetical protein